MGASISKRDRGIPMPIMPTENIGMMSGPIRKPRRQGRRMRPRGSRPDVQLGTVTQPDGSTLITYGSSPRIRGRRPSFENLPPEQQKEITARRNEQMERRRTRAVGRRMRPRKLSDPDFKFREPDFMSGPSAVQETTRVNVQDPTLGGPPEREVPIPKERRPRITRESDPRGPAPFAPDDNAAKDRFFETMFERAANQKERRAIDKGERRDRQEAMRDEARMRDSEMGGNRRRRRDFTRRRPEKRRSREERAAFRDRYVSTLGSNFFS